MTTGSGAVAQFLTLFTLDERGCALQPSAAHAPEV